MTTFRHIIHAIFNDYEALIDIRTVQILEGNLPTNKRRIIFDYVQENQVDLLEVFTNYKQLRFTIFQYTPINMRLWTIC